MWPSQAHGTLVTLPTFMSSRSLPPACAQTMIDNGITTPLQIVALRAESYSAEDGAVVISLRAKYSTAERKYLVPLACLQDLVLDLQRLNAATASDASEAPELPLLQPRAVSEAAAAEPAAYAGIASAQDERPGMVVISPVQETAPMTLRISSPAFADGQRIPEKYTADGDDISPPLDWSDAPAGTKSFLLVVEDPDAPGGIFHHWGLYNLQTRGVPEGFASADRQDDIESAVNDFGESGYRGPAPPPGHGTHHYHFKVAALDVAAIDPPAWAKVADVWRVTKNHVIGEAELVGTYSR
jgi:Raf kinase inhibitor-like YbhB/YbcL family protein